MGTPYCVRLRRATFLRLDDLPEPIDPKAAPAEQAMDRIQIAHLRELIEKRFARLPYRQRVVLRLQFGLHDGYLYPTHDIARIFKISRERAHVLSVIGRRSLEHPPSRKKFEFFFSDQH